MYKYKIIYKALNLLICINASSNLIAQQLNLDETLKYLSKISKESPYLYKHGDIFNRKPFNEYFSFDIQDDNLILNEFQQYKSDMNIDTTRLFEKITIPLSLLDLSDFKNQGIERIEDNISSFEKLHFRCKYGYKSISSQVVGVFAYVYDENIKRNTKKDAVMNSYDDWWLVSTGETNNLEIFRDGILYIVDLLKERKNTRELNNPFSNVMTNTKYSNDVANQTFEIPIQKEGSVYSTTIYINNSSLDFILDSGAGECSISEDEYKKLVTQVNVQSLEDGLYQLANGSVIKEKRFLLPKLMINGAEIDNIIFSVTPTGSSNLLGQSFLRKFKQWSIDNNSGKLILN